MEQQLIPEAVSTAVTILSHLEDMKKDAKADLTEVFDTYGCTKAERRAIKKAAMARIKGKTKDLGDETDAVQQILQA